MSRSIRLTMDQLPARYRSLVQAQDPKIPLIRGDLASKGIPAPPKASKRARKARTRNAGQWTEARYWQALRSALRRAFRFWGPAKEALLAARVAHPGPRGRKWAYRCANCGRLFVRAGVQVDHVEPCGELTALNHLPEFVRRLTPEDPAAFKVLCTKYCHRAKTAAERSKAGVDGEPLGPVGSP